MVRSIMKDQGFLSQSSEAATREDMQVAIDLIDTLKANKDACVGMAANMIGVKKCIIAFENDGNYEVMYNSKIIKYSDPYEAQEGCLSLMGTRKTKRYKSIKVEYENEDFLKRIKTFSGFTAQIIQHEIDHCNGVII